MLRRLALSIAPATWWLFLAVLLFACAPASADIVYGPDSDGDHVHVTDKPCPASVPVPEDERGAYFLAHAALEGKSRTACAALVSMRGRPGPQILIVLEDGQRWVINFNAFKPAPRTGPSI